MADSYPTATGPPRPAPRGPWQAVTRFSARTPLRIKLIAALLALVIAALAGISIAGAFVFRGYLHSSADHQVKNLFTQADLQIAHGISGGAISAGQAQVL